MPGKPAARFKTPASPQAASRADQGSGDYQPAGGQQPKQQEGGYANPAGQGQTGAPASPPTAAPAPGPTGVPMVDGLLDVNLETLRVQAKDVVNVREALGKKQVLGVVQAINGHPQSYQMAEQIGSQLQGRGLLRPGDRVVGVAGGKVYALFAQR